MTQVEEIKTEIQVVRGRRGWFFWTVKVSGDVYGITAGKARGALQARFQAGDMCQRMAAACLKPFVDGVQMELKALKVTAVTEENPSGANLSRGHTA